MGNWCTKKKAPQITRKKKENFPIRSRQLYRHRKTGCTPQAIPNMNSKEVRHINVKYYPLGV